MMAATFDRPSGRYRGVLLTEAESLAIVDEINRWCRKTGTNYNKLVIAAGVNVSTRSSVRHRQRRLTIDVARRLQATMSSYPQGITKAEHKARLRKMYQPIPREEIESRRVNREPCPKCGTRADIGCKHSIWSANHYGFR
jgi:hypothetical protein